MNRVVVCGRNTQETDVLCTVNNRKNYSSRKMYMKDDQLVDETKGERR